MLEIYTTTPLNVSTPKTTKEFAIWLRSMADEIDKIPDSKLIVSDDFYEVGFDRDDEDEALRGIYLRVYAIGDLAHDARLNKFSLIPLPPEQNNE